MLKEEISPINASSRHEKTQEHYYDKYNISFSAQISLYFSLPNRSHDLRSGLRKAQRQKKWCLTTPLMKNIDILMQDEIDQFL